MHDLPREELGHGGPDHVGDGVEVRDDAPHLPAAQPARLGAQPQQRRPRRLPGIDAGAAGMPVNRAVTAYDEFLNTGLRRPMGAFVKAGR